MDKMLFLFIMLCSGLLEVRCLQCYVCDNCPKVNEEELQTCGMQTTPGPSTISTTTTQPTTPSTTESTTTPGTTTSTTTEPMTILTITTIEPIATSTIIAPTTNANTIATITTAKPKTNSPTSASSLTTIATESTTNSIATNAELITNFTTTTEPVTTSSSTIEPLNTSKTTTGPANITKKPAIISTISTMSIEPTIPTEPMTISTKTTTESSTNFTTITEPSNIQTETVTESVVSYLTSTESRTTFTSIPFISTLPTIIAEPTVNFTTEPTMDTVPISVTNYPESTNKIKAVENTNVTYKLTQRRPRSLHEDCACSNEKICDCLRSKQRSKRYALRGLGLAKEGVKYVCIVDKFKVNETEVVKRGCAVMEEDESTSCVYSGFGENCKVCEADQCNGAPMAQTSAVLMFIICCIHYFSVEYIVN